MEAEPSIRCVSTGGEIAGHDELTYRRWLDLVEASRFRDRFLVKGCLPEEEAARYRARADLGVVTERPITERVLGSSGRILDWLGTGLPFVCSSLSEIGTELEAAGLAFTYTPQDAASLANRIVEAAADREALQEMARQAMDVARERWSEDRTTAPLRAWARAPRRAPDHSEDNPIAIMDMARKIHTLEAEMHRRGGEIERLEYELGLVRGELESTRAHVQHLTELSTRAEERAGQWEGRFHDVRSELGRIHNSAMWRAWMLLIRVKGALTWPLRKWRGG